MKIVSNIIILVFVASCTYAQQREIIELWSGKVPGEEKSKAEAVRSPGDKGAIEKITEVTNPLLEVFPSENPNGASVIINPGGGYYILAIDKEGYEIAEWFNRQGITAFVLHYRVPQKQEGALQDIQRAIRVVRSQAESRGLNPDNIGTLGFSAGGSLSARASTRYNDEVYDKTDAADKLSARPDFTMLIYAAYLDKGPENTVTPEIKVTEQTPPMFLFVSADDKHANSSLVMTQQLREHNVPVELHVVPEGKHGYGLRPGNPAAETWPLLAEKWIEKFVISKK